ncbi:MAG: TIGR03790 family protein [Chthoniobacterales bacterium]
MSRLIAVLLATCAIASAEVALPPTTVVVFNKSVPESVELAKFYAEQRGIARDHLVGLDCSPSEEISREEYDATIRNPLRRVFQEHGWWKIDDTLERPRVLASSIHFIATIKGVPLKIRGTTNYEGDKPVEGQGPIGPRNDASVDSELAVLGGFSQQISGTISNPYFKSYRPIAETDAPGLLLVSRLDAPTEAIVRRMITDSIAAERNGLSGRAFVDGAHNTSGGMQVGDAWMTDIRDQLRKVGIPVVFDDAPEIFPAGFPITNCALYYGWYASAVSGAMADPALRFVPGAIAVHIHSFSASTLREANAQWAAPLIAHGAAATLGNVYEPYLQLTAHLDIFNDRLLHGFTLAESAAMATPALSWMNVVVGDPLYRPFGSWLALDKQREVDSWRAYHEFAAKNATRPPAEYRAAARQFASRTHNAPMIEDVGLMEMQDGNFGAATSLFSQARSIYSTRDDIVRVVLEESDAWLRQKKPKRALDLIRSVSRVVSDSPAAPLLKHIEQESLGALSRR